MLLSLATCLVPSFLLAVPREGTGADCTGRIGNFVWHDLDGNGIQDPGEPGLPGVRVLLTDL
ncbi:MAG TPA: SdrD B-like domain-containing protein, partial [Planctomycetota bacterium]